MSDIIQYGTVIEKIVARDLANNRDVHILKLRCGDDAACEVALVVPASFYAAVCIEAVGGGTVIEYGVILRVAAR